MPTAIRQLNTQTHYAADGANTVWPFSFTGGYIDRTHVKARTRSSTGIFTQRVIDVVNDFVGEYQLRIFPAVPVGTEVQIYRETPRTEPLVNFSDGSQLPEANLDLLARQAIFVGAEALDVSELGYAVINDVLEGVDDATAAAASAQSWANTASANAAAAVSAQSSAASSANNAATWASAAATSASSAQTAASATATNAASVVVYQGQAAASATAASTSASNASTYATAAQTNSSIATSQRTLAETARAGAEAAANAAAVAAGGISSNASLLYGALTPVTLSLGSTPGFTGGRVHTQNAQITLPAAGLWTVRMLARIVPTGTQGATQVFQVNAAAYAEAPDSNRYLSESLVQVNVLAGQTVGGVAGGSAVESIVLTGSANRPCNLGVVVHCPAAFAAGTHPYTINVSYAAYRLT